jgi:hypothetical protein
MYRVLPFINKIYSYIQMLASLPSNVKTCTDRLQHFSTFLTVQGPKTKPRILSRQCMHVELIFRPCPGYPLTTAYPIFECKLDSPFAAVKVTPLRNGIFLKSQSPIPFLVSFQLMKTPPTLKPESIRAHHYQFPPLQCRPPPTSPRSPSLTLRAHSGTPLIPTHSSTTAQRPTCPPVLLSSSSALGLLVPLRRENSLLVE